MPADVRPVEGGPSDRIDTAGADAVVPGDEPALAAGRITRGVRRRLAALGHASIAEFPLANGRRADVLSVDPRGRITIVEVKSSVADFRSDRKWNDYLAFCDLFYFAVAETFPLPLLPEHCGVLIADAYDASVLRDMPEQALAAARRKAVMLRFAQVAAGRLHRVEDGGARAAF